MTKKTQQKNKQVSITLRKKKKDTAAQPGPWVSVFAGLFCLGGAMALDHFYPQPDTAEARTFSSVGDQPIFPENRVVAYYGNFYSKRMGVLGEYPTPEMINMLEDQIDKWEKADPHTPVVAGIDYIAIVAQRDAGKDGKYRSRMPDSEIQKAIAVTNEVNGVLILDVQVGLSTLQAELPHLEPYLKQPNVMLAIDPEFSMKDGSRPGTRIGSFDAADINYAAEYLAKIVKENNLPPKFLVVHRFTKGMVTNYKNIKPLPEVQIVIDMDGWGYPAKKISSYQLAIQKELVQYTGFKVFYKNDLKPPSTGIMTPEDILKLSPQPHFILYQ